MNGRIAILCPTRGRPHALKKLIASVKDTSRLADVIPYVDQDQELLYKTGEVPAQITFGPRIGPVASANRLVEYYPDYDVYGLVTDDSVLTVSGWDKWVMSVVEQFPNRICVISPRHNHGEHVDMPFVTRGWIEALGWFACPTFYHYCWPIITGLIGEASAIVHAPEQSFSIHHEYDPEANKEAREVDLHNFFGVVSRDLPGYVDKARNALNPYYS